MTSKLVWCDENCSIRCVAADTEPPDPIATNCVRDTFLEAFAHMPPQFTGHLFVSIIAEPAIWLDETDTTKPLLASYFAPLDTFIVAGECSTTTSTVDWPELLRGELLRECLRHLYFRKFGCTELLPAELRQLQHLASRLAVGDWDCLSN